uniref:Uncharacterized protein n=1 Tax=viral metagenome TaxID=1070528 RepID=A0A6C0C9E6_9ZZZZ
MKNELPDKYSLIISSQMDIELRYGYVKFKSAVNPPIYIMICIDAMKKYFDEFKTFDEMIPELSMEYYNNLIVINQMPIEMLVAFKILVKFVTLREVVNITDVDEEINLLKLLCKLGNRQQIQEILNSFNIDCKTWVRLLDEDFDVKNFFCDRQKIQIYATVAYYAESNKAKCLSFYGIPYFENLSEYDIKYAEFGKTSYPQNRVFDKTSNSYYLIDIIGDKVLLYNRHNPIATNKNLRRNRLKSSSESSSESSSDEDTNDLNGGIIKLPTEIVQSQTIRNYTTNAVDVYFGNAVVPMLLVTSGPSLTRSWIFRDKYRSDYERLRLDSKVEPFYIYVENAAEEKFSKNHIYVPPVAEIFESLEGHSRAMKNMCDALNYIASKSSSNNR